MSSGCVRMNRRAATGWRAGRITALSFLVLLVPDAYACITCALGLVHVHPCIILLLFCDLQQEMQLEHQKRLFKYSKVGLRARVCKGNWAGASRQHGKGKVLCSMSPWLTHYDHKALHDHGATQGAKEFIKQYKKPILQSAFDLQSRLTNQVQLVCGVLHCGDGSVICL